MDEPAASQSAAAGWEECQDAEAVWTADSQAGGERAGVGDGAQHASSLAGESEEEDGPPLGLESFLLQLRSKYGLLDSPAASPLSAAGEPAAPSRSAGEAGEPGPVLSIAPIGAPLDGLLPSEPPPGPTNMPAPAVSVFINPAFSPHSQAATPVSIASPAEQLPQRAQPQGAESPTQLDSQPPPAPLEEQQEHQEPALADGAASCPTDQEEDEDAISQLLLLEERQRQQSYAVQQDRRSKDDGASDAETKAPCSTAKAAARSGSTSPTSTSGTSLSLDSVAEEETPAAASSSSPTAAGNDDSGSFSIPAARLDSGRLPWPALNASLLHAGFPPILPPAMASCLPQPAIATTPDNRLLFEALDSLLREHARLGAHMQRLAEGLQGAGRREAQALASFGAANRQKEEEVQKWKRLALENQQLARGMQLASSESSRSTQALVAEARQLGGQVQQLEHALRSKDVELDTLRQRLAAQLGREERRSAADRKAYERLKRAWAASRAAEAPSAAAAVVAGAVKEMRPQDICRVMEAERTRLQEELAVTKAEKQLLEGQVMRAREAMHAAGVEVEGGGEELEGQARLAVRAAAAAEERAAQLAEEVTALRQELAARPTAAQLESLQRQVAIMERQAQRAAAEKAAAAAKATSSENKQPRPRELSTRELVQRDRSLKRLGLYCVEELPKPVLVEVVQDACLLLECRDPLKLSAAITPVQDLAALVPRMERWIGDVCGAVFQAGLAHVPEALRLDNPADVPAILGLWIGDLSEHVEATRVLRALCRQLGARAGLRPGDPPPTPGEVAPLVAQLVELERSALHSAEVLAAAETALAAQPEVLINRIVRQFQHLFGVGSVEGVLPAMAKLYAAHAEAQTFLAALRTALGLDAGATLEACANRLQELVEDKRELLATMLPAKEPHVASGPLPEAQHATVVEVASRRQRRELQAAADAVIERLAKAKHFPPVEIYVPAGPAGGTE